MNSVILLSALSRNENVDFHFPLNMKWYDGRTNRFSMSRVAADVGQSLFN